MKFIGSLSNLVKKMEGADALTRQLFDLGIPMAIATSSNYESVQKKKILHEDMFARMDLIVCGDDACLKNGKPAPDIYLLAAERMGYQPKNCLVFEDAFNGVLSGNRAGMTVIACPDPRLDTLPFQQLTPHIIRTLNDFQVSKWNFVSKNSVLLDLLLDC